MSADACFDAAPSSKEFRDTRLWAKYLMGGIAGVGIFAAVSAFYRLGEGALPLIAAGAAAVLTLAALAITYFTVGRPVVLRQTENGIQLIVGDKEQTIPYDELFGFRAKWTDVLRNGVYSHTQARFAFSSEDPSAHVLTFDSTPDYGSVKFEQLQRLQDEVAAIIAGRMAEVIESEGCVKWTEKLSIRRDSLEIAKKRGAAPEPVSFDRISQWKLDQGLFKLGIDGSLRPVLVEETSQWNFYPGLLLFCHLCQSPSDETPIDEEEPAVAG